MTKFPHPNPDVSGELDDRNRMNTLTGTEWMRSCTSYWETEGVYGTLNNEIISRLIKLFSGDMCYYSKKNKFENHKIAIKLIERDITELQHFNSELHSVVDFDKIIKSDNDQVHYLLLEIPNEVREGKIGAVNAFAQMINKMLVENRYVTIHQVPYPPSESARIQLEITDAMLNFGFDFKGKVNLHNTSNSLDSGVLVKYSEEVTIKENHSHLLHFRKRESVDVDIEQEFTFAPLDLPLSDKTQIPESVQNSVTKMDEIGKSHPAPYSPSDISKLMDNILDVPDGWVIDPFSGVGSTHMACIISNDTNRSRKAIGIDLNPEYFDLSQRRIKSTLGGHQNFNFINGDSLHEVKKLKKKFVYSVTSPPYHDILRNKGAGVRSDGSQYRQGVDYYSEEKEDVGNQETLDEYFSLFISIMDEVKKKLLPGSFCSIVISDFTVKKKEINITAMTIDKMKNNGWIFCGEIIFNQRNKAIAPFGYPYAYVINHTNQCILNFKRPADD
tara:strand:+ start:376 stop:1875 length:1500 start_codon:yes stop_codon:yes gene_type:complete